MVADDAATWALGTSQWLYPESVATDGAGDAFRHCIWSAAITQRVGPARAERVLTAHEAADTTSSMSVRVMDLGNNSIGRSIGSRADAEGGADTWGWIIQQCQSLERNGWLYRLGYDPSGSA